MQLSNAGVKAKPARRPDNGHRYEGVSNLLTIIGFADEPGVGEPWLGIPYEGPHASHRIRVQTLVQVECLTCETYWRKRKLESGNYMYFGDNTLHEFLFQDEN